MLADGLYDLSYRSPPTANAEQGYGVFSLRNGRILGSDRWGGVFRGEIRYDAARELARVALRFTAPAHGVLVTGLNSGPHGLALDITAELKAEETASVALVAVAGSPVAVEFSYIGPLPRP